MRRANFLEPVTLVRSPMLMKLVSGRTIKGSNPLNLLYGLIIFIFIYHKGHKDLHEGHKEPLITLFTPSLKSNTLKLISKPNLQFDIFK